MENNFLNLANFSTKETIRKSYLNDNVNQSLEHLKDVTQQFEAIFLNQLLKQARKSNISEGIFNSEAEKTFNSLIDQEYSDILSKRSNFGISEALFNQFKHHVQSERKK